ncbi:hypothetical protein J1614_003404 [Plenodomus biglobosus]|nr:hypothetical protein J1614_003404 [Plenodomus biglobosus]
MAVPSIFWAAMAVVDVEKARENGRVAVGKKGVVDVAVAAANGAMDDCDAATLDATRSVVVYRRRGRPTTLDLASQYFLSADGGVAPSCGKQRSTVPLLAPARPQIGCSVMLYPLSLSQGSPL